jgi:uncharacterized Ntn-hydrolase superfamily protein
MTYSLLARCARTGRLGLGMASHSIAIGLHCDGAIRPNVGVAMTQGFPNPRNNRLATNLLAQGHGPGHALRELAACDPHHDWRQIGIVDREGTVVVHSGARLRGWAGHRAGAGYVAMGSQLAGTGVVDALAASFEASVDSELEERLLLALEAARDAGGLIGTDGPLPERSVAAVVWSKRDYSDFDLRVDMHPGAIAELRRIYIDYMPSAAYYEERARNPRNAIPAMEFADMLKNQQAKETR